MERISLENDDLEGANNVYVFDTATETVLIDTGEQSRGPALRAALENHEVTFADIDEIFLTHWHPDHSGLAGVLQEASGATVRIHECDAPLARGDEDAWKSFTSTQASRLESWGVPAAKRQQLFAHREQATVAEYPSLSSVTTFGDGETFTIGDQVLEVHHTPGHTAGSVCFALERRTTDVTGRREIITGDTLLPKYTPNIGGTDVRLDHPLEQYLSALRSLESADYDCGWPGHRTPIEQPSTRAREIITHHEQRAGRILSILDRIGPADVWTVCTELFGELDGFHILVGAGEAYAHLEHLQQQGAVECVDGTYRAVDEVRAALDSDRDVWPLASRDRSV
ncbi:MAG: glyoxylase-like metal-dependent hydrolase (beta-lactamase superfamily II) [Haloarculaceae archaeon]|jgi:glyoxylase-like metal-dependent hydrolase (beta-lactamase superfamily II)